MPQNESVQPVQENPHENLLDQYKGRYFEDIVSEAQIRVGERFAASMQILEQVLQDAEYEHGAVYYLGESHQAGDSINKLAAEFEISRDSITRLFRNLNIPVRTYSDSMSLLWRDQEFREKRSEEVSADLRQRWQDPEYRHQMSESSQTQWQDPEYRRQISEARRAQWQDPEYRRQQSEASSQRMTRRWHDPELRSIQLEAIRARFQDPEYRRQRTEAFREMVQQKWQDPAYRQQKSESFSRTMRRKWQDPEYRRRHANVMSSMWQNQEIRDRIAQARLNPDNLGRFVLPTIYGTRRDVGFTQSSWEANIARVLIFVGRDYLMHEPLQLSDTSWFELDFLTIDNRGQLVGYEIMAHPLEEPDGWEKLNRATLDYPDITFRVIDIRFYNRLRRQFAQSINIDPRFAGWEEGNDNLRTNPQKFGNE